MLHVRTNFDEIIGLADELKSRALDLGEPLARIGGYFRGQAKRKIDAGLAPLMPSTIARKLTIGQLGLYVRIGKGANALDTILRLEKQLARTLAGPLPRSGNGTVARSQAKAEAHGEMMAAIQANIGSAAGFKSAEQLIAFAHKELARARIHGAAQRAAKLLQKGSAERRKVASQGKKRYDARLSSTIPLGGFRNVIKIGVGPGKVVVFVSGPAAKANNEGATVGHGAELKARKFLDIGDGDVDMAAKIVVQHMVSE